MSGRKNLVRISRPGVCEGLEVNRAAYSLIEHSVLRITDLLGDTLCAAHVDASARDVRCTIPYNDSQYNRRVQPLIKLFIMASRSKDPEDDGGHGLSREDAMVVWLLMMRSSIEKSRSHHKLETLGSHFKFNGWIQGVKANMKHDKLGWR